MVKVIWLFYVVLTNTKLNTSRGKCLAPGKEIATLRDQVERSASNV